MSNKIVFMGTPDFAVESLRQILDAGIEVAGVITAPDRKSGRGQQVNESSVKKFASDKGLKILQPSNLKDEDFQSELRSLNANLFVVVAFRMLPESVWGMPKLGTINLHGSLLPEYRGAAPINWAVINGDEKTGCTTFFIQQEIDTGKIIGQIEIEIGESETAGEVHDRLMVDGAKLLTETITAIFDGSAESVEQLEGVDEKSLGPAPKIFKDDCLIDWSKNTTDIYNKIRGLSPYPTAWCKLESEGTIKTMKLFRTVKDLTNTDNRKQIKVESNSVKFGTADGWIELDQVQLEGKKRMSIQEVMNGFDFTKWNLL